MLKILKKSSFGENWLLSFKTSVNSLLLLKLIIGILQNHQMLIKVKVFVCAVSLR